MGFWLLCWGLVKCSAFINTVFIQGTILILTHLFSDTGNLFFNTIGPFLSIDQVLRRSKWILDRYVIGFFIFILILEILHKLVNKTTIIFKRKFLIIIDGNTDLVLWLDDLLLVVKLFEERVLENLEHGETFLWVELEGFGKKVVARVWDVWEPFVFWNFFDFWENVQHLFSELCL